MFALCAGGISKSGDAFASPSTLKFASSSFGAWYFIFDTSTISGRWMTPSLQSSKKHRAVASTSYAASWASPNPFLKSFVYSSVSVGHLNLPPLPPGIAQNAVASSLESIDAMSVNTSKDCPNLCSSAPTIFTSNSMLCPMIYVALPRSL